MAEGLIEATSNSWAKAVATVKRVRKATRSMFMFEYTNSLGESFGKTAPISREAHCGGARPAFVVGSTENRIGTHILRAELDFMPTYLDKSTWAHGLKRRKQ